MNLDKIDKSYVSPYDKFLFEFDMTHEKSASQQKEIAKHKKIANLRDNVQAQASEKEIWEEF